MTIEQLINLVVIVGLSLYLVAKESYSKSDQYIFVGLGILLLLGQFVLNKIFAGESTGMAPSVNDVLLVKEISFRVGLAVLGYLLIATGLLARLHTFFTSRKSINDEGQKEDDSSK